MIFYQMNSYMERVIMTRATAQHSAVRQATGPIAQSQEDASLLETERALTGFEWTLWRLSAAFIRWQGECLSVLAGRPLGGHDTALLHVVAYQDRSKGLSEIAKLLGRTDLANIQYAIRKLNRLRLIERVAGLSRKDTLYRVTPTGADLTRAYRALRRELLVAMADGTEADFRGLDRRLIRLTELYESATRQAVQRQMAGVSKAD
jgi:predicted MarR family transcription regulator